MSHNEAAETAVASALGGIHKVVASDDVSPEETETQLVALKIFMVTVCMGWIVGFIHEPSSKFFQIISGTCLISVVALFFCSMEIKEKINRAVFKIQSFCERHCPDQVRENFPNFFTICLIVALIKLYLNFLEILRMIGIIKTEK